MIYSKSYPAAKNPGPSRWALTALVSSVLLMSACSSLQVDVDVYKGPLVNHESMQRDQMTSMAMSAKSLLLSMRNRMIDNSRAGWTGRNDASWRSRTLNIEEIVAIIDKDWNATDLRNMRQINDILSFYDDVKSEVAGLADELQDLRQSYEMQMKPVLLQQERIASASNRDSQDLEKLNNPGFSEAQMALRRQWEVLTDLLQSALYAEPASSRKKLIAFASGGLANLTQPRLVACGMALEPTDPALAELNKLAPNAFLPPLSAKWGSTEFRNGRRALEKVLISDPEKTILALKKADLALRNAAEKVLTEKCDSSEQSLAKRKPSDRSEILLPRFKDAGVVRMPRSYNNPDEAQRDKDLTNLVDDIQFVGTSGFDNGRPREGIDRVATKLALRRQTTSISSPESSKGSGADGVESIKDLESRLDGLLVDLAARIQFLAGNLWLLDDPAASPTAANYDGIAVAVPASNEQINRYKALLEGIANNILVHADDLRHRKAHEDQQLRLGAAERNAQRDAVNVSDSQAFIQVVQAVKDEKQRVLKVEAVLGDIKLSTAKSDVEKAEKAATAALGNLRSMAALSTLLLASNKDPQKIIDGTPAEWGTASEWLEEKKRVEKKLSTDSKPVKLEALRAELEELLTADNDGMSSPLLQQTPSAKRYAGLLAAAKGLRPLNNAEELARADAYEKLRKRASESYTALVTAEKNAGQLKRDRDKALATLANEKPVKLPDLGHKVASEKFDAAVAAIMAQRTAVITALGAQAVPPDARLTANLLVGKLDAVAAGDSGKDAANDAKSILVALSLTRRVEPFAASDDRVAAKDVLDETITQLRRLHLEAVQRGGKNGAEATRLLEALETARKQREDMIYIRPTGSYLRSVYASTFLQNDPGLRSRNLLLDGWRRMFQCKLGDAQVCDIRTELDKAHWQNINTVRLDGSGGANFVIAKDDVGNWYVKAMGTDPKAMINAVKGLALYNMGGRFNADLLRVDELRARVDDTQLAEADRTRSQKELDTLTTTKSGPAVAARTETLGLFTANYQDRSKQDLDQLAGTVKGDTLQTKIRALWDTRISGDSRTKLDEVFAAADVTQALEASRTAVAGGDAQVGAGETITSTLAALHKWRGTLKMQVIKLDALTEAERSSLTSAQASEKAANLQVETAQANLTKAKDAALVASAKLAVNGLSEGEREVAVRETTDARAQVTSAESAVTTSNTEAAKRKTESTTAETKLQEAKTRQQQMAADVDTVVLGLIDATIKRRLQLVQETETAVKVVGHRTSVVAADTPATPAKP